MQPVPSARSNLANITPENGAMPTGRRAVLLRRQTISSLPGYRPSPLSNEVVQPTRASYGATNAYGYTARAPVTLGNVSTQMRARTNSVCETVVHHHKENIPPSPGPTREMVPEASANTTTLAVATCSPASQSHTAMARRDIPLHNLRQYVSSYRRLLPAQAMRKHRTPDSPLMTQRLSTRPLDDEIHEELMVNRKRKWTPSTEDNEDTPPQKRVCLPVDDETLDEQPSQGVFTPRLSYNPPTTLRRFRLPQWGSTKKVETAADVLRLHSLAVKREMPRKGAEGWLEYDKSSSDVLTTEQDLCWTFESMEIDDVPNVSPGRSNLNAGNVDGHSAEVAPGIGGRLVELPQVSEQVDDGAASSTAPDATYVAEGINDPARSVAANNEQNIVGLPFQTRTGSDGPFYFGIPWEQSLLLGPAERSADLLLTPPSTPWFESALFRVD